MTDPAKVWFNPNCSKCRALKGMLEERGVEAGYYEYLTERPPRAVIEAVLSLLGADDPRAMMRTKEPEYLSLGLAQADRDALLDAMASHPNLIERPIFIQGDRAIVARPPEKALGLL